MVDPDNVVAVVVGGAVVDVTEGLGDVGADEEIVCVVPGAVVVVEEDCFTVGAVVVMVDGRLPVVEVSTVVVGQC